MVHRLDTYRTDIDGIRALAVLAVLLFHFQFEDFVGGYVGVDVFFVISGFLITGQILKELRTDTFSFVEFYKRRVRRLFPALFCMLLATLVAGTFLLAPEPLEALGESSLFAVFSLSNLLFYSQSGYFDSDSIQKPLLHTWSLGVEEQFYLFWPLFLFLIFIPVKKRQCRGSLCFPRASDYRRDISRDISASAQNRSPSVILLAPLQNLSILWRRITCYLPATNQIPTG